MTKLVGKDLESYWDAVLERRMPETYEVERLISILKGFYFSHCKHNECFDQDHEQGLIDFHDEKRPYGNKAIGDSIAFNLGWDYKRQLTFSAIPDKVEAAAMDLHEKVLAELKQNTFLYV